MKYGIVIMVVIAVIGGAYWFGTPSSGAEMTEEDESSVSVSEVTIEPREENKEEAVTEEVQFGVYENEAYGFRLSYPAKAELSVYTDEMAMVKIGKTGALVDIAVVTNEFDDINDIDTLIYNQARMQCDADGVEGSVACVEVKEKEKFVSTHGIEGEKFVLEKIITTADGEESHESYGPIFAFPISNLPTGASIGAVLVAPSLSSGDEEAELLDTIANSFDL